MENITCQIRGSTPYYFNKMWKGKVPKTKAAKEGVAEASVPICNGGHAFVPWKQIKGCIKQAMSLAKMKVERSNKRALDLTIAALWVQPEELIIAPESTVKDLDLVWHDIVTEQGKIIDGAYMRFPSEGWILDFTLEIALLEPDFIREALEFGGLYCGIGGRRQDKNGRFELIKWK